MTLATPTPGAAASGPPLLESFSLEMTAKDADSLADAARAGVIPGGTPVNLTYLATEDLASRVRVAELIGELGLVAVPHISARRLSGEDELREYLTRLAAADATERLFVVGGDPQRPEGPYPDALSVISSGVLEQFAARSVGLAGYPEGHPDIADDVLWRALTDKHAELERRGLRASVITQFCFDAEPVLAWVREARRRGIDAPIRIGVPGPAGIKRLLAYARRFGVGTGTEVVRKYGLSLTNLLGSAGPDRFLHELQARYDPATDGELAVHFYAFGGLRETAEWISRFRAEERGDGS